MAEGNIKKPATSNFFDEKTRSFYGTYTSIEQAIDDLFAGDTAQNAIITTLRNFGTVTEINLGNQFVLIGWMNNGKTYGWFLAISFAGIYFGKRYGTTTTSWTRLDS